MTFLMISLTSYHRWMSVILSVKVDLAFFQTRFCQTLVAANLEYYANTGMIVLVNTDVVNIEGR